jgi:hypothetical protein
VTALRLTEKGYRVGVLEAGRRFADSNFPGDVVRRFLWAPEQGCRGIQWIHLFKDVIIFAGSGVGGVSLVEPQFDGCGRAARGASRSFCGMCTRRAGANR